MYATRRTTASVVGAALFAGVALAGCGSSQAASEAKPAAGAGYVAGDGSAVILTDAERKPAPDLQGTTLDGKPWSLADQKGHVTAINVWASWCAPCRAEAPTLERTYKKMAPQGVRFVGIDTRDSETAAKEFVAKYGITYPNLPDPDGQLQLAFRDTLPPQSIPSTIFIDAQGRVAARILGRVDETRLTGILDTLVKESQ